MKTLAFYNRYSELNPHLFTQSNAPIGDDLLLPINSLATELLGRGVKCSILGQLTDGDEQIGTVFIDRPTTPISYSTPLYLVVFENETIVPENWGGLGTFSKVFSWAKAPELPSEKFVQIFPAQRFSILQTSFRDKNRFCCLISSNKQNSNSASLYSKRAEAIKEFSNNSGFDLYGPGWSSCPSWRGILAPGQKRPTLANYRFGLAFENASFNNYITEKIFDCLIAGTVPVYYGAPNINMWVDPRCYINVVDYPNWHVLRNVLENMTECEWNYKRQAGIEWMESEASKPFRIDTFTKTIINNISY